MSPDLRKRFFVILAVIVGCFVSLIPINKRINLALLLRNSEGYQNTPIIFLTTETKEELKSRGTEMAWTYWITKPFSPVNLLALFDSIMKEKDV